MVLSSSQLLTRSPRFRNQPLFRRLLRRISAACRAVPEDSVREPLLRCTRKARERELLGGAERR